LERFLTLKGYPSVRREIDLLRLLQEGRSQIAVNGHQELTHLGHEELTHPGVPGRVALTQ
jgi:hypothetical protein